MTGPLKTDTPKTIDQYQALETIRLNRKNIELLCTIQAQRIEIDKLKEVIHELSRQVQEMREFVDVIYEPENV
jgi:hypothetical protein